MLLGYLPLSRDRQAQALQRKRREYMDLRRDLYEASPAVKGEGDGGSASGNRDEEQGLLHQIRKDLPRTRLRAGGMCAAEFLVEDSRVQALMERILFVWAVRQPASGYVQGLNDVLIPPLLVFLAEKGGRDLELVDVALLEKLSEEQVNEVEADVYWCVTKILSEIFDHYTHGQPGIQRMVQRLKDILFRIDEPLSQHLEVEGIDILHTAFRWITCLMVRELPVPCCVRFWDACIAESALAAGNVSSGKESAGFEALMVYFCACFTAYFSANLQAMDFEAITFFLQKMPTDDFGMREMETLLGEAYVLKSLFQQAPKHLQGN